MNITALTTYFTEANLPKFRLKQTIDYFIAHTPKKWVEVSVLPKDLREKLAQELPLYTVTLNLINESSDVIKFLFDLPDTKESIEAVIMKHEDGRRTLCLSCQAGCPMGCTFCATGTLGLKKNLSADEMFDTVLLVNQFLSDRKETTTNIVYMGMGEPFVNYQAVKESLQRIHDALDIGWRKFSVSTSGIIPRIKEFAKDFPQVNLAISLHAASEEKRTQLMPINKQFPLADLMDACKTYVETTNRKIFFEYLVIAGFNDTNEDVKALRHLMRNPLYHVNLIRFHATDAVANTYHVHWRAPSREELEIFKEKLNKAHIIYTLRKSFGETIDAACGMLALKNQK